MDGSSKLHFCIDMLNLQISSLLFYLDLSFLTFCLVSSVFLLQSLDAFSWCFEWRLKYWLELFSEVCSLDRDFLSCRDLRSIQCQLHLLAGILTTHHSLQKMRIFWKSYCSRKGVESAASEFYSWINDPQTLNAAWASPPECPLLFCSGQICRKIQKENKSPDGSLVVASPARPSVWESK